MILLALTAAAAIAATAPPGLQRDLQAPAGPQPKPHVLRDLKAGPRAYQAPSVLLARPEGNGALKDLWISPRVLPDPAHPFHALDKDLRIGPPGMSAGPGVTPVKTKAPLPAERTLNLFSVPERCKDAPVKAVDRDGRPRPRKLTDLPNGALLLAVDRKIDGCPVLTIVHGDVSPEPQGPIILRAEPLAPQIRREDGPSNRR